MLKCPKCGTENLMQAIFCRGCGEKIDLEALSLEDQIKGEVKVKSRKQRIIELAVTCSIIGIIVLIIGLMLIPCGHVTPAAFDKEFIARIKEMSKKTPVEKKYDFTNEEVTAFFNQALSLPKMGGDDFVKPQSISIRSCSDGRMKIVFSCALFDFLPFDISFAGTPVYEERKETTQTTDPKTGQEVSKEKTVRVIELKDLSSFGVGWMPFPSGPIMDVVGIYKGSDEREFSVPVPTEPDKEPVVGPDGSTPMITIKCKNIKRNVTNISVSDGKLTLDIKPRVKK